MDTWTIIGVFFLGVFSYRFLASLLNYTHSYNFLTYCLASCLTMIRSFGKDVVTVKERLIKQMEDLDIPEEEKEVMKKRMEKTLNDWQSVTFVRVIAVIPKEFSKVLKTNEICDKIKDAFSEVNK
jgi:hypothetical protein